MADEQQQERTEQATAKRREDFREKGQVAQSREVQSALLLTSFLVMWFFYVPLFWRKLSELTAALFSLSGSFAVTPASTIQLALLIFGKLALLMAPLLLLCLAVGFLASFMQIGWLFTTKPLEPDFSKFNPISGLSRMFSKRSLVELLKSMAKVILVGFVAYKTVRAEFAAALDLIHMEVWGTLAFMGNVAGLVLMKTCGILAVLAILDFFFVRYEMEEKMKMTKQEQKEEFKETEGDPQLKSRIRSIQHQMARKRMMAEVPKADVIVTNPTHISVALSYQRDKMKAPKVVAKGADLVAMKIREIAREHQVPIVENVPVARALHKVNIGAEVPEELFKAVAEILAYVYNLKGKKL
ncbi:MAG: flagellar biosynthesis protein FlhB [Deltaproteobacteria bacterium]|nr:flagellar biosynthesis protein FlhB [Deltaproteobacteria bacterium]